MPLTADATATCTSAVRDCWADANKHEESAQPTYVKQGIEKGWTFWGMCGFFQKGGTLDE